MPPTKNFKFILSLSRFREKSAVFCEILEGTTFEKKTLEGTLDTPLREIALPWSLSSGKRPEAEVDSNTSRFPGSIAIRTAFFGSSALIATHLRWITPER